MGGQKLDEPWSDDDREASHQKGAFAPVGTTSLGVVAIVGMAMNALCQLVCTAVLTASTLSAVGVLTYALVQYDGGLQTNEEEALAGVGIGALVFVTSLIPLISGLAAGFSAVRLWRGGRSLPLYVAATFSMSGPMVLLGAVSLTALASPIVGLATSFVGIIGVIIGLATAILAIVVASKNAHP